MMQFDSSRQPHLHPAVLSEIASDISSVEVLRVLEEVRVPSALFDPYVWQTLLGVLAPEGPIHNIAELLLDSDAELLDVIETNRDLSEHAARFLLDGDDLTSGAQLAVSRYARIQRLDAGAPVLIGDRFTVPLVQHLATLPEVEAIAKLWERSFVTMPFQHTVSEEAVAYAMVGTALQAIVSAVSVVVAEALRSDRPLRLHHSVQVGSNLSPAIDVDDHNLCAEILGRLKNVGGVGGATGHARRPGTHELIEGDVAGTVVLVHPSGWRTSLGSFTNTTDVATRVARVIDEPYDTNGEPRVSSQAPSRPAQEVVGNDISVFLNGNFALDDTGLVQQSGPWPLNDGDVANEVLSRTVSPEVQWARTSRRPGRFHIRASPIDPTSSIRVDLPRGFTELRVIGRLVADIADEIAGLIDGAHADTITTGADAEEASMDKLYLQRPAISDSERDGELPSSLEELLRLANSMYLDGVWANDEDADRRVKRRINYLTDYQSFPSLSNSAEQRQAEAMTPALSADILQAVKEAAGIDLPGLDQVLAAAGHLSSTDGTDSDLDRAEQAAAELESARQHLLQTLRSSQISLPADLDTANLQDPDLVRHLWAFDQQGEKSGKTLGMAIGGVGGAIVGGLGGFASLGPIGAVAGAIAGLGSGGGTGKFYGEILGAITTVIGSILRRFERKPNRS